MSRAHSSGRGAASIPGELVARLSAASAGSRGLDLAIHERFFPRPTKGARLPCGTVLPPGWGRGLDEPSYTTSLDAALALAERVLPGWMRNLDELNDRRWGAGIFDRASLAHHAGIAPTPALALCIAILKATTPASPSLSGYEAEGVVHPDNQPVKQEGEQ